MDTEQHRIAEMLAYLDKYFFAIFVAVLAYIVLRMVFRKRQ
ncbi:hypothetical protein Cpin_1396 [Chitinophaga pinensis DSM 2588]|uniref:Uncharacterized protein n=1 Tax=Chitinophaga pinensis (strain ATCC 43595 / DSM 2588 / LMG 13176 / NBRC 15968 / NCIMB 11800 / UQM 2034) TaxID=485918 RepID=A0A979GNY5_CHIPD|nr:hypothetical protein Cpin_1396 [Chitinophaga pinensis DSM 2588]